MHIKKPKRALFNTIRIASEALTYKVVSETFGISAIYNYSHSDEKRKPAIWAVLLFKTWLTSIYLG
jgi:hypothetical protein